MQWEPLFLYWICANIQRIFRKWATKIIYFLRKPTAAGTIDHLLESEGDCVTNCNLLLKFRN